MQTCLNLIILTILTFASSNVYAQQMSIDLAPNASKKVTNHYGWTLNATCTIQTKSKNKIRISVLDNKGSVNGHHLAIGQSKSMLVHNNDCILVSAEPGTQVTLQNLGVDPIQATCAT